MLTNPAFYESIIMKKALLSVFLSFAINICLLAAEPDWTINPYDFQYDMTAYVHLSVDGVPVSQLSSYTIAAFHGDECRGIVSVRSAQSTEYGYLRIRSNQSHGETITFQVFDSSTSKLTIATNQITFQANSTIGYPSSPLIIHTSAQIDSTFVINHLQYTIINDTAVQVAIADPTYAGEVSIPAAVIHPDNSQSYAVTHIADNGFYRCPNITSVLLSEGLRYIGEKAFAQSAQLSGVLTIPSTVTQIGDYAFYSGVNQVHTVRILSHTPPTITKDAWSNVFLSMHNAKFEIPCGALQTYLSNKNWKYLPFYDNCGNIIIDQVLYRITDQQLRTASAQKIAQGNITYLEPLHKLIIPDSIPYLNHYYKVTSIPDSAFIACTIVDTLVMGNNVIAVGKHAFYRCTALTALTLSSNLQTIGDKAFAQATPITGTITFAESLKTVGEHAFYGCAHIDTLRFLGSNPPALSESASTIFYTNSSHAIVEIPCGANQTHAWENNFWNLTFIETCLPLTIYHTGQGDITTCTTPRVGKIYYKRTFTPYVWETIYLPFEVESVLLYDPMDDAIYDINAPWNLATGGYFYLATGVSGTQDFSIAEQLQANTPYIIQFSDNYYADKEITFVSKDNYVNISTDFAPGYDRYTMYGNTTMIDQTISNVFMLNNTNTFYYHEQPLTLHPFECYVAFDRTATPAHNARMFSIRYVPTNNATLPYLTPDNLLMQYYDNHLHLQPNGLPISVYTINGTLLFYSNGETSTIAIPLHSGCYLLRYANQTHKIIL